MVEYVGLDVSKEETSYCVMDGSGGVLACGKAASDPDGLFEVLREHCLCPERIVLETGTLSNWLARGLRDRGLSVEVIDARRAHAVMGLPHNKTDANDAELLAELARTGFFRSVAVKSEAAQLARMLLKARAHLVGQWKSRQNAVRGLLGGLGIRIAKGTGKFVPRVRAVFSRAAGAGLHLCAPGRRARDHEAGHRWPDLGDRALRQARSPVPASHDGARPSAPITAMAFAATIDDAGRFAKSRAVGAYLGLTARASPIGRDGL